ncbi:ubiquitin carboxyl-terminal hydrolase 35 isoform X2 [Pseudomyrmex gracilis]|uniref:ubiquitin carboxyl-terminal hydrolase 35 isoform X2 n=1 Tax=Pseudomyrmex gracilis TaxID=219809 RepID=UPI0009952E84|nr:ubiquitin carboxyl-terminal hydrolase 35 isoform X2 [Pseudomyrmex gracilis]
MSGNDAAVNDGWTMLQNLQDNRELTRLIDCEDILRSILRNQVINVSEVPKIMAWMSPYIEEKRFNTNPISNDVATLLQNTDIRDMSQLTEILNILTDHRVYLPRSANYTKLCEAIVTSLSSFQMPLDSKKIQEFYDNTTKIQNFLKILCSNTKNGERDSLMFTCLQTLYNIISDTNRKPEPGPGLAAILQLVESSVIPQAVDWILSQTDSDRELVQALKVLCNWLPKWTGDRLSVWIMEFIRGLEKQRKYCTLLELTESSVDILTLMCSVLMVPVIRQNASNIIFYILKRQSSVSVVQNIAKRILKLIKDLMQEDSESSKDCIQNLVDIMKVYNKRFSCVSSICGTMENYTFPMLPRPQNVREIYKEPVWIDETKEYEPVLEPERPLSGKVGLSNLGNTCYMNSVLQALLMTRQFCQEVLTYRPETGRTPLLEKLQNLFALLLYSKRICLAPTEVLQASRPTYFLPGQQQDSSEFLCHLLDLLHEQEKSANTNCGGNDNVSTLKCKSEKQEDDVTLSMEPEKGIIKRWTTEEDLTEGLALQRKTQSLADFTRGEELGQRLSDSHSDSTDSGIQSVGGEETSTYTSLVHRVLGGECQITYQCTQCDTSSRNTDKFRDLQLCFPEEIQENQEVSVQDLINYYLTPEKLTGENKYRCDKCTKLCDAQRIITILQAPAYLILTLKHFRYDFDTRLRAKLRHKVVYNDAIQLPVSVEPCTVAETYNLYAAVVHSGYSMDYGHYFTYACDSKQNWYKFNDSFVTQTTFEDFKNLKPPDTPYILFYEKSSAHDGIYEDDKLELSTLSKRLQELIANDTTDYIEELRRRAISSHRNQLPTKTLKQHNNSDDDNPPPSSCRGAIDVPANRFLF